MDTYLISESCQCKADSLVTINLYFHFIKAPYFEMTWYNDKNCLRNIIENFDS